jgi:hypothetical protein
VGLAAQPLVVLDALAQCVQRLFDFAARQSHLWILRVRGRVQQVLRTSDLLIGNTAAHTRSWNRSIRRWRADPLS